MRRLAIVSLAVVCLLGFAGQGRAQNENLDFKLVNKTGVDLNAVYIAPHDSEEWGDDVMGQDTLDDGNSVDIQFHPKTKAKIWDLRVEDEDGKFVEWESLDLSKIDVLTLKIVKGKAVAEWK